MAVPPTHSPSPDVIVVGGGSVGVACAYELARFGAAVSLFERESEVGRGCSYGNAGLVGAGLAVPLATPQALREGLRSMLRPDAPFHLRPYPSLLPWLVHFALACRNSSSRKAAAALAPLGADAFAMHLAYAAAGIATLEHRGAMLTWETEKVFDAALHELRQDVEADITVLDLAQARRAVPLLAPTVVGAVVVGDTAHTDSARWTQGVAQAGVELGAKLVCSTEVRRLASAGGRVTGVETSEGIWRAGAVVIAAGAWSAALVRPFGLDLRLQSGKGYHVDLDPLEHELIMPLYMQEAHVVATPLTRCLRLAGTLDLAGIDLSIDERRTDAIVQAAERNLVGLAGRHVQERWAGLRPCTADGIPTIGTTRKLGGLVVATGHAMIGLALAPVTGRLVTEIVHGTPPSHDIEAFSPDRFSSWPSPGGRLGQS